MKTKYLIILSFDAVSSEDVVKLREFKNFKYLIENGSLINNVESIYPTLTYPAHASIITGMYPSGHGIINNTLNKPFDTNPDWYWYSKYIKSKTLFELAKENDLTTASLLWPVTGRSNIDYNLPEIFCTKPWHNQLVMSILSGSLKYQLDLNKRFSHIRDGISQPALDNFVQESVKYTILKYKPNLMLIHFTDVDAHRHYHGYNSVEANEALKRHDVRLGEIIDTLKGANILKDSTIIALGDHSTIDGNNMINVNVLLKENGLLEVDSKGKLKSYKAIAKSCDGSSYIYLKNRNDKKVLNLVSTILNDFKNTSDSPIEFILSNEEAVNCGADPECSFMLEAKRGFYFVDELCGNIIETVNECDVGKLSHRTKSTHGYSPTKDNYGTFLVAFGKGIKKGTVLESGKIINHGPTFAKLLGLNLVNTDGMVEDRILDL